ncbi:MAG: hypothetical protein C5S41_08615 [Candidatus Methanomarinus sp.]|nr:MAG: hypothetical protein C5S41_08615 [ANME-2 cluster archaeon]
MSSSIENNSVKLDEVLRRLEHVESSLLMGEVFPDEKEIKPIKDYITKTGRWETEFIALEEIRVILAVGGRYIRKVY